MKFLFVDETMKGIYSNSFLCICGLIVDQSNLIGLNNSISEFKGNYGFKNLKELRTVDKKLKIKFTGDLFEILNSNDVNVISAILGDPTLQRIEENYEGPLKEAKKRFNALSFLLERFYLHLRRKDKQGKVISDSLDPRIERKMQNLFHDYISNNRFEMPFRQGDNFKNVIFPSISFSNDEHIDILQCSDLIAYSLNGAITRCLNEKKSIYKLNVEDLEEKNQFIQIYWPLFEKDNRGRISGWGIKLWH